jgi:hypothetical protein
MGDNPDNPTLEKTRCRANDDDDDGGGGDDDYFYFTLCDLNFSSSLRTSCPQPSTFINFRFLLVVQQ